MSYASFFRLVEIAPPPDAPVRADGDWKRFTSVNGFPPPEDYRMLLREYGAGTFGDWMQLIEPFNPSWTFMELAEVECKALRQRGSLHWTLWPEPGGFLPWATTTTGDHVGWKTEGRPNEWTTLFWGNGDNGSSEFEVGAIDFIVGLAERSLGDPNFDAARNGRFLTQGGPSFLPATR